MTLHLLSLVTDTEIASSALRGSSTVPSKLNMKLRPLGFPRFISLSYSCLLLKIKQEVEVNISFIVCYALFGRCRSRGLHVQRLLGLGGLVLGAVAHDSVPLGQVKVECDQGAVLHAQSPQSRTINLENKKKDHTLFYGLFLGHDTDP